LDWRAFNDSKRVSCQLTRSANFVLNRARGSLSQGLLLWDYQTLLRLFSVDDFEGFSGTSVSGTPITPKPSKHLPAAGSLHAGIKRFASGRDCHTRCSGLQARDSRFMSLYQCLCREAPHL
jgi:hypothetical protein